MKTLDVLKEVLAGKRMSESSKRNYEAVFSSLHKFSEEFPVKSVEVNKWLVRLKRYSDQTVRLWFTILRNACEYMETNYELPNPCKGVYAPKVKKRKRRYFKAEEIVRILQACRGELEYALIMTLVDSGCRIGGLSKLRGKDVGDSWLNVREKTGERRYRLDARLCEVLRRMAGSDDNPVFGLSDKALSMRVIRICRRAGLKGEKLGPHTLRHSSASLVAADTKNAMAVKAFLQHDNIQTSMIYVHDVEEEILKGISPLQLVADRISDNEMFAQKQLPVKGSEAGGDVEVIDGDGVDDLLVEMFPEIGEGVAIRPLLKTEDLVLIRKGFMEMAIREQYSGDVGRARELMKRMIRRVK
ncbi:tyrosine recombinase XerC [Chloroflexota bacterium]